MSTKILRLPLCGPARQHGERGRQGASPARDIVKIVGFNSSRRDQKHPLHDVGTWNNRVLGPLDLRNIRLAAAKLGRQPLLRFALPFPPRRQFQRSHSRFGNGVYCDILYLVNGHKRSAGSEYKQMAYVLTMHPGNRIRELRKQAKLSQTELAQRSGVSQPYISQIENQDSLSLDIARMRTLARQFDCAPADLLIDADNPDRLDDDERALIAMYRSASDSQRELIRRVAEPLERHETTPVRVAA